MQTVIDPPSTRSFTRDQWAQLAGALVTCVSLLIVVIAAGLAGLWAGGGVGNLVRGLATPTGPAPIDLVGVRWPFMPESIERGFLPQALGVGAAGIGVKLIIDLLPLLPAFIQPLVTFSKTGVPDKVLSFGDGAKATLYSLFDNWRAITTVLATTFSLNAAAWVFKPPQPSIVQAPNNSYSIAIGGHTFLLNVPPSTGSPGGGDSVASRAFVVFFEEEDTTVTSSKAFRAGLLFAEDASTKTALARFAGRLAYCNRDGKSATVRIKGFASSSPFKSLPLAKSDELNKALANERARTVADILSRHETPLIDGSAPLTKSKFVPHVWEKFDDMSNERAYEDRVANEYSLGRGQLNRRAELVIEDAAACTRR
ncbi:MAG: hypothetical protein ABL961_15260 [Vicinamibacterales bacterium]